MGSEEKLQTLTELAKDAGVTPQTLRRAAEKGFLPATLYGKTWLTTKSAVETWVKEKHNPKMRRR